MRFCILGSGSSGNSALIETEGSKILLDAGFSARRLEGLLAPLGESIAQIDAVFVTVEPEGGSTKPSGKPMLFTYLRLEPNHP